MTPTQNRWAEWLRKNETARYNLATKQGWDAFVHAAPRAPLERLSLAKLNRLGVEEREDYDDARAVWNANPTTVHTAQLARAYGVMNQLMASNQRDSDRLRGAVVIDAAPALGKTTIATRYSRDLHRKVMRRHGPRRLADCRPGDLGVLLRRSSGDTERTEESPFVISNRNAAAHEKQTAVGVIEASDRLAELQRCAERFAWSLKHDGGA